MLFKCPKCGFLAGTSISPSSPVPKCTKDQAGMEPVAKLVQSQTEEKPTQKTEQPHDR